MVMEPDSKSYWDGVNSLDALAEKFLPSITISPYSEAAFDDGMISKEHIANALQCFFG